MTWPAAATRAFPNAADRESPVAADRESPAAADREWPPGGVTPPPPYVGTKAASLDGVDEYLTGPAQSLNSATGFSYSFWFLRNDSVGTEQLLHIRQSASVYLTIQALATGTLSAVWQGFTGGTTSGGFTVGVWCQVVVTVDRPANNRVRVWVNGSLVRDDSVSASGGTTVSPTLNVARAATGGSYLNGKICDIARWSTPLDGTDATNLYNSGVRGNPEVLTGKTAAALWAFQATDNMTGTSGSIADLKGGTALTPFNTESGDLVAGP